jgi:hypothetical protein
MVAGGHMTRLEAMEFLKVGHSTFDTIVKANQLAFTDLEPGGRRFYRKSVEALSLKGAQNLPQSDSYQPEPVPTEEPPRRRRRKAGTP